MLYVLNNIDISQTKSQRTHWIPTLLSRAFVFINAVFTAGTVFIYTLDRR